MRRFLPRTRLGLRARITLAFGLGALLLSALVASITWGLTRENLLSQRDANATDRVLTNAVAVSNQLGADTEVAQMLDLLPRPEGANPLIRVDGDWFAVNALDFSQDSIDPALLAIVESGTPARMRYDVEGSPLLVVGTPVPSVQAVYFEGVPLDEIERTLSGLAISLLGAAAVTTLAGFAIGFYASGRTLRPLIEVGEAAEAIAGGALDTRLESREDPDLRPLTDSFNHMAVALQDKIERDARFASEVSHELRSPLMTITAAIEVLDNSREELPERARTAVDLLTHDIERFQQLVEDLLEMSRFDAGAVHLDRQEIFIAELAGQAVAELTGGSVPIEVGPGADQIITSVDKLRIGQVIANLLDNAKQYAGGATVLTVEDGGDVALIAVVDGGPGVTADEREIIFDRFSRGSAGGRRTGDLGTGLGLALVREHVQLHGGQVWVEDRLDGESGARFVVELPALDLSSPEADDEDIDDEVPLDEVIMPDEPAEEPDGFDPAEVER